MSHQEQALKKVRQILKDPKMLSHDKRLACEKIVDAALSTLTKDEFIETVCMMAGPYGPQLNLFMYANWPEQDTLKTI